MFGCILIKKWYPTLGENSLFNYICIETLSLAVFLVPSNNERIKTALKSTASAGEQKHLFQAEAMNHHKRP